MSNGTGAPAGGAGGEASAESVNASQVQDVLAEYLPAAKEESKGEEKPTEEKAVEGEKAEGEKPEGEASVEGEVAEEAAKPSTDVTALQNQIKALSDKLEAALKPKEAEKPKEEKPLFTKYFNKQEEFEAAFERPEAMEAVLNKVKSDAKQEAVEEVVKNMPQVVTNLVRTHLTVVKSVDDFYSKNPNLNDKRDFVSHVANELMGKNPGWSLKKLFGEELGKEVNRRLGVKPGTSQPKEGRPGQPPAPRGTRRPAGKEISLEPLQKEIVDLVAE